MLVVPRSGPEVIIIPVSAGNIIRTQTKHSNISIRFSNDTEVIIKVFEELV
jgi:hypothetical protein